MRTTLTIDKDIFVRIEKIRQERRLSLKKAVNTILREGLNGIDHPPAPRVAFQTSVSDLGQCRVNIDDIADALAFAEGDGFK